VAQPRPPFLVAATVTALAVVFFGWWAVGLRTAMHGALLVVAVFAFLPILIVGALLLAIMIGGFIVALLFGLFGHGSEPPDIASPLGEAVIAGGGRFLIGPYYRFLASRRHPLFWGLSGGVLLGGLLLLALIAVLILPGEARTSRILIDAKDKLDRAYQAGHGFPKSLGESGAPTLDGFGRPLEYRVTGKWMLARYRVASLGYDGKPGGGDDLCVSGSTRTLQWANAAAAWLDVVQQMRGKEPSVSNRLAAISALKCGDDDAEPDR
jgi:hypothetical protein